MSKKIWYLIAAVLIVVVAYAWYATVRPASDKVVTIGVIAPMSGDAAAYGQEEQKVISYRLQQINASGKNKTQFEVIYEDGKCAGNDSVNAFQKLVDIDGVKFIIGGACSSETMSIAPLATERGILTLSPFSSNPAIEGLSPYTFTLSYSDRKVAEDLAKEMGGYSKVALVTEQNDYNVGLRSAFLEIMAASNPSVSIVADEVFPKGNTDFRTLLEKVRRAGPEAVLLNPNPGVTAENLLRQLAEMKNWTGYQLYGQYAYLAEGIHAIADGFTDGMIIVDAPTVANEDFAALKDAIIAEKGSLDSIGNYYSASALDAIDLMTTLIEQYGNDPEKVRDALASGTFDGMIGAITFQGHNFVQFDRSGTYVVQDGKVVLKNQ